MNMNASNNTALNYAKQQPRKYEKWISQKL